ncbi:MAG TPA: bifunctional alpha,alpha-trehalose-phosphate synthase (UDP-forming)/trehalose-phosphatase [Gemmatimonadales bacterium]|nr:bifunctional alpha,alpha-trehalose-phosphate synthase (UDP-forming)/trehalose-phosphatase [Gemmatimonadales bacterium]
MAVDAAVPASPAAAGGPLVLVSNRLPFQAEREGASYRFTRSPGGLVTALDAAIAERGGVWIGWPGIETESGTEPPVPASTGKVTYRAVPLTSREVTQYYGGFANRTLWPLFHYFVARTEIDSATWRAYERVNRRFATAAAEAAPADALIWVHDYQLMMVPGLLRSRRRDCRVAFFLHIPFPAADVFRILPWSRDLMRGLLGADLVGFHIREYAEHFLTCADRLLGCETDRSAGRVLFEGREIAVEAHPISIDVSHVEALAARARPTRRADVQEIIGVDRLDYTKGITERLLAVERLFELEPSYRGRVQFTQILVPSRERVAEYRALKREIDEVVGRINGRFSDRGWAPIRYIARAVQPEELAAYYRQADVALVTPLRDGMNLVAKEFVASQLDLRGVLVLSELAGAAAELPEALIVNPYDVEAVAATLHRALSMTPEERRVRMSALRDRVRGNDVHGWSRKFLASAAQAAHRAAPPDQLEMVRRRLTPWLVERPVLALFLDYDGTLAPIAERPDLAHLPEDARRALEQAVRAPELDVTIVSGRPLDELRAMVGVEGLTLVGEHGYDIEGPGVSFRHEVPRAVQVALARAEEELRALDVPGSIVERKRAGIAFHFRAVVPEYQERAAASAAAIMRRRRLAVLHGKAVVEGRPGALWDKGRAVLHILNARHGPEWPSRTRALYVGDDTTDGFAFAALRGIGRSILVRDSGSSEGLQADFLLRSPLDVANLVRWLAAGAFRPSAAPLGS